MQKQSADTLAQGLGWFSIALGAAELAAPRTMGQALGMADRSRLIQAYGLREIATGIGILASRQPKRWVWGRVAGDALDMATLATGLADDNPRRGAVGAAMGGVVAVTLLDLYCANQLGEGEQPARPMRDYSNRSGFPEPPDHMRGQAAASRGATILSPLL